MDKYLENAFWLALENAVKDRSVESISKILEQMKAASTLTPPQTPSQNECSSHKNEGQTTKGKMPYGTTSQVKSFVESRGLFSAFLQTANPQFRPNDFRLWLDENFGGELTDISEEWRQSIGTLFKYFSNPNNKSYKGIVRLRDGVYACEPNSQNGRLHSGQDVTLFFKN